MAPVVQGGERRRRVGAVLDAYYHIDGATGSKEQQGNRARHAGSNPQDQQGFDAGRYFDDIVASGRLPDLVQHSDDLNAEIHDLDTRMQAMVYTNYSKFIGASSIIKQMKFTIDGFGPDLQHLEGKLQTISHHEQLVEQGVAERSTQIEALLKQQEMCKKLKTLFSLPSTLRGCLERDAYGSAVEAYCCCFPTLRQHKDMPSFKKVLEEVELQMSRIRTALEQRLQSAELPVGEAVNSSLTLLSLGEDLRKVAQEFATGRAASLQRTAIAHGILTNEPGSVEEEVAEAAVAADKDAAGAQQSQLWQVCSRIHEHCTPSLIDTLDGFRKIVQAGSTAPSDIEDVLTDFMRKSITEICRHVAQLAQALSPPVRVLMASAHLLRDSMQKLHAQLPTLLTEIFREFFQQIARSSLDSILCKAALSNIRLLPDLHKECCRLQALKKPGLDEALSKIAEVEERMAMNIFKAILESQPLLELFGNDPALCSNFAHEFCWKLVALFGTIHGACTGYVTFNAAGSGAGAPQGAADGPPSSAAGGEEKQALVSAADVSKVTALEWSGLFALALVRLCRHIELKLANKIWAFAQEQVLLGMVAQEPTNSSQLVAGRARAAAQALMDHYVLVHGARLAELLRNSVHSRNWMTVKQTREPRPVVEVVLREACACEAQLARILGDPRRAAEVKHAALKTEKSGMELEMERLWAKKQQIYGLVVFNRSGAVMSILRIALKAFFENLREETFGTHGLQQIQVDCARFRDVIHDLIDSRDAGVLDSLLDEALGSATHRCVEPMLMDPSVVTIICREKKKPMELE